jgi:double-stranded uracil-DNA glycosylase
VSVLPDYLGPELLIAFCGTAAGEESARRAHYYAGPGNEFWAYLYLSGLTPERLGPELDSTINDYGLGLTDLAKHVARSRDTPDLAEHFDIPDFLDKIERFAPRWVAFHGKARTGAASAVSHHLGHGRQVRLGPQPWAIGESSVFVVPSASASNRDPRFLEGRPDRLAWFAELAQVARR